MKKIALHIFCLVFVVSLFSGCATSSKIPEGEYVLRDNIVHVKNPKNGYKGGDLLPYIKQDVKGNNVIGLKSLFIDPILIDTTLIHSSIDGMVGHLEYLGYYDSKITPNVNYKGKRAKVTYDVELGKTYPINNFILKIDDEGLANFFDSTALTFNYQEEPFLSEVALDNEADRLSKVLRNHGYYGFNKNYFFFYADTTAVKDSAKLVVEVKNYTRNETENSAKPHTVYTIGDVTINPINGLEVTEKFLHNVNRVYPDKKYSETDINNAYQRFVSNRVFSSVNMELIPRDSNIVDCDIMLSPSKMQSLKVNLEGSVNSSGFWGISPQLSYTHKNLFKGGENFNISMRSRFQFLPNSIVGYGEFGLNASLSLPQFLLLPSSWFNGKRMPTTNFTLNYNYQERPEYERRIFSFDYGYSWDPSSKMKIQFTPAKFNMTRIFNIDSLFYNNLNSTYLQSLYSNHFDLGGNISLYYSTTTETTPSDTYFYLRWQNDFSGNLLSLFNPILPVENGIHLIDGTPYSQYVRTQLSLVQTFFFGREKQFQLAGRLMGGVGIAYGNATVLPLENMFFAGGSSSLRGWQTRTIGPGDSPIDANYAISNQVGDMLLEANLEFRFPIFWKLKGAIFADAGNIWNLPDKRVPDKKYVFDINRLGETIAFDWGVGARLDFGMILVRVDMGIKQYDPVSKEWKKPNQWFKQDGYTINFGIGYPF